MASITAMLIFTLIATLGVLAIILPNEDI